MTVQQLLVGIGSGTIQISRRKWTNFPVDRDSLGWNWWSESIDDSSYRWRGGGDLSIKSYLGLRISTYQTPRFLEMGFQLTSVYIPVWVGLAPVGMLTIHRFVAGLHGRYLAVHGRCRACGYDLRATPARCPECGTEPMQNAE